MSGPIERATPAEWLEFAEEDLTGARLLAGASRGAPWRMAAFHAQQCAEKSLKGYLLAHQVRFPYTHNIDVLMELCAKHGVWTAAIAGAESLSIYAQNMRYPGEDERVTKREAAKALKLAEKVIVTVKRALRAEGLHPKGRP